MDRERVIGMVRLAGATALAVLALHLWLWDSLNAPWGWGYVWIVAVPVAAGALAGSWWSVLVVPAALVVSFRIRPVLECPDCRVYSESPPPSSLDGFVFFAAFLLVVYSVLPVAEAAGILLSRAATMLRWRQARRERVTAPVAGAGRDRRRWSLNRRSVIVTAAVFAGVLVIDISVALYRDASRNPPASNYASGPAWDGRGGERSRAWHMTQRDLDRFDEYPLYWLGPSFAGYNLQFVEPSHGIYFAYGECKITPCSHPVSLVVRSVCSDVRPEHVTGHPTSPRTLATIRGGALGVRYGYGQVHLWTGRSSISLFTWGDRQQIDTAVDELRASGGDASRGTTALPVAERMADQALHELRGVGLNAAVQAGDDLPPPDFSGC